jgi:hypothetical protein
MVGRAQVATGSIYMLRGSVGRSGVLWLRTGGASLTLLFDRKGELAAGVDRVVFSQCTAYLGKLDIGIASLQI